MRGFILLSFLFFVSVAGAQNRVGPSGKKTGHWVETYPGGNIRYEGYFKHGDPVGELTRYYPEGGISARMYFDSTSSYCYTKMYYKNGKLAAEGPFLGRSKDSVWTYYSEFDGEVRIRENYEDGMREGQTISYYPGGNIFEILTYDQDLKNGPWIQYYDNGTLKSKGYYQQDKLNGPFTAWYPDSTLKITGTYWNNLSDSTWTYYNQEGSVEYSVEFDRGKAVDQERYLEIRDELYRRFDEMQNTEEE